METLLKGYSYLRKWDEEAHERWSSAALPSLFFIAQQCPSYPAVQGAAVWHLNGALLQPPYTVGGQGTVVQERL